jgi:hypothetical protein
MEKASQCEAFLTMGMRRSAAPTPIGFGTSSNCHCLLKCHFLFMALMLGSWQSVGPMQRKLASELCPMLFTIHGFILQNRVGKNTLDRKNSREHFCPYNMPT